MRRPLFMVALCVVIVTAIRLGYGWLGTEDTGGGEGLFAGTALEVTGQVYQKDQESITIKSVVLCSSNSSEVSVAGSQQQISNLICEVKNAEAIPLGSKVRLSGTFMPFSRATNQGEFDSSVYYRTLGICGKLKAAQILEQDNSCWKVREWLFDRKSQLCERLYSALAPEDAAIMEALILGEKGNLDSGIKELYKRNGILHILSISSLHITIIGMSVYKLLRKVGLPIGVAAVAGAVLLLLYGCMTGFGVSATRAIGMYLIRMLGEVVGRTYDMLTALGVMAAVMVVKNPYYLQNGGFLLSFSCVLGIGVVYPALLPELKRYQNDNRPHVRKVEKLKEKIAEKQFGNRLCKSFFSGLSVTLATLPVQLYLYYESPVWSVFLNLLVIPCLEPLMLFGILTLVAPGIPIFGGTASVILQWYEFLCENFERVPFSTWNPGCPDMWQIVVYYVLLGVVIGVCRYGKYCKKRRENRGITCVCIMAAAVLVLGNHTPMQNRVFFLDVGQGDCILVQTATGENYLFDCGSSSRNNVGKYVLLPFLKYQGIHTLDGVFVSHPDTDHAGGILELLEMGAENNIVIGQLVLPHVAEETREVDFSEILQAVSASTFGEDISVRYVARGDAWSVESVDFLCLHPERETAEEDSNAYSQSFLVQFYGNKALTKSVYNLLLTGDVGAAEEKELGEVVEEAGVTGVAVLKVAHHGSRYSSSEIFLQTIQPTVSVISCSENNSYGHPHEETLERLEEVGSRIFSTAECGQITVTFEEEGVRISGFGK